MHTLSVIWTLFLLKNKGLSGAKACKSCSSSHKLSYDCLVLFTIEFELILLFSTTIYLQKSASMQPRTSRLKFSNLVCRPTTDRAL